MAVLQISRIQHRRGFRADLPNPLNEAEIGWATDTRELFIGNGPFFPGNTQIVTEVSPAHVQRYIYRDPDALNTLGLTNEVSARTGFDPGGDPFTPTLFNQYDRSYQEKFDEFVSVRDYGATGNGITDDTDAIVRCLADVYNQDFGNISDFRKRRAVYFPAGTYRIRRFIPLYPFSNLLGDGQENTRIFLDWVGLAGSPGDGTDAVAKTVDTLGQSDTLVGDGAPLDLTGSGTFAGFVFVHGIQFESNTPVNQPSVNASQGLTEKSIVKLTRSRFVTFSDCRFRHIWVDADGPNNDSYAVMATRAGQASAPLESFSFVGCSFNNVTYALNFLDTVRDVRIDRCSFVANYRSIKTAFDGAIDTSPSPIGGQPTFASIRITNGSFSQYSDSAIWVGTDGRGIVSMFNDFKSTTSGGPDIVFSPATRDCTSIGDTFADDSTQLCSNIANNPRVANRSSAASNVIINSKDSAYLPNGICGPLTINGDLTVDGTFSFGSGSLQGDLNSDGTIFSDSSGATGANSTGPVIRTLPVADFGNALIVHYAIRQGSARKIGTLKVIASTSAIDSIDDYTELGATNVTVTATFNPATQVIDIRTINSSTLADTNVTNAQTLVIAMTV